MGNQLCKCLEFIRPSTKVPVNENTKIHHLVDLTKNPSSDITQHVEQNRLSHYCQKQIGFVIEPNDYDQSFDSSKVRSPQGEADTSLTLTQISAKNTLSPLKKVNILSQSTSKQNITEESPMLQDIKTETVTERESITESAREREIIELTSIEDSQKNLEIGLVALSQYKHILDNHDQFEDLSCGQNNFNIKLKTKGYQNAEKFSITCIIFSYSIKTTREQYIQWLRSPQAQKQTEPSLEAYEITQAENCSFINVQVKKMSFLDAREYNYLKYVDEDPVQYTEVCKSINFVETVQPKSQKMLRGVLHLSGLTLMQRDEYLDIHGYLEVNTKLKLHPNMIKKPIPSDFKAMVERQQQYFFSL